MCARNSPQRLLERRGLRLALKHAPAIMYSPHRGGLLPYRCISWLASGALVEHQRARIGDHDYIAFGDWLIREAALVVALTLPLAVSIFFGGETG